MFYKISILLFLSVFTSLLYASQIITAPKGYSLDAKLTSTSILLGETTQLTLIYRYGDVEDYEVEKPEFTNIIVKELDSKDYKDEDGYFVEEINYSLQPQKEGNFSLKNIQVQTQIIDGLYKNFDNRSKYTKVFSLKAKAIILEVKKLPNNITAIGKYRLSAKVDKSNVQAGELVTLTISLYGDGNIQNLDAIMPHINNATTYLLYTTLSKRQHLQTKVYEIISDQSYHIPSFELHYFDKEDSFVKKSSTNRINVKIDGYQQEETKIINNQDKYFFFILAILLFRYLYSNFIRTRVKKEPTLIKTVKSCRIKSDLYKKIVVYLGRDEKLDSLIYQLEDESKPKFKLIKKEIIKRLIKLRLHERDNLLFTTKDTL
ncbi:MAG: BatD family protein [Sulfurimonas sp.]|nr:BatD family protein [Sulfurimonas sp.]